MARGRLEGVLVSDARRRLIHLTTADVSLDLLLGPQLRAFAAAGYEVVGCSAPGPHVAALKADGIRHIPLASSTRSMSLRNDLRTARELAAVVRRERPDILHTHNPKPGVYGRLVGRALGVPVVVNTVHGLYAQPTDPVVRRAVVYGLERLAATCSRAELVQNPEDIDTLRSLRVPEDQLVLLGNGVDLDRFDPTTWTEDRRGELRQELGLPADSVVVGMVGRLVREKGYLELIEAAERLARITPSALIVVVGPHDPEKADGLSGSDLERGRRAGIRFLGMRDDIDRLYAAMDVFVLPSHREGFPRSAMEAAAMGLPLICTDIRGCRQVVEEGVNGHLVAVGDVSALTEAIARMVNHADHRQQAALASRRKALAEFDDRRQVEVTLGVYDRLLAAA